MKERFSRTVYDTQSNLLAVENNTAELLDADIILLAAILYLKKNKKSFCHFDANDTQHGREL